MINVGEKFRVCGDEFECIYSKKFKTNQNLNSGIRLSWSILDQGNSNYIVLIPWAYGEDEVQDLLKSVYVFPNYKSVVNKCYYVTIQNTPLETIVGVLSEY